MQRTRREAILAALGGGALLWAGRNRTGARPIVATPSEPLAEIRSAALSRSRDWVAVSVAGRVEVRATARLERTGDLLLDGDFDQVRVGGNRLVVAAGPGRLAATDLETGDVCCDVALAGPIRLLGVSEDGAAIYCREDNLASEHEPLITTRRSDTGATRCGVYLRPPQGATVCGVHKIRGESVVLRLLQFPDRGPGFWLGRFSLETGELLSLDEEPASGQIEALDGRKGAALTGDGRGAGLLIGHELLLQRDGVSNPWRRIASLEGRLSRIAFNDDASGAVAYGNGLAVFVS